MNRKPMTAAQKNKPNRPDGHRRVYLVQITGGPDEGGIFGIFATVADAVDKVAEEHRFPVQWVVVQEDDEAAQINMIGTVGDIRYQLIDFFLVGEDVQEDQP